MPGTYSKVLTVNTGDTITASERNSEHDNHINNCDFSGLGDYSADAATMRATTDPYPASTESLATDGKGEIERLRYLLAQITGMTYWYQDPSSYFRSGGGFVCPTPDATKTFLIAVDNDGQITSERLS